MNLNIAAIATSLMFICAATSPGQAAEPTYCGPATMTLDKKTSYIDAPPNIRLTGLKPIARVRIDVLFNDVEGTAWRSAGHYRADSDGVIDIRKSASVNGTYRGVDPFGLFWSSQPSASLSEDGALLKSQPTHNDPPASLALAYDAPQTLTVRAVCTKTAFSDAQEIAQVTHTRRFSDPRLKVRDITHGRLRGKLFSPPKSDDVPIIIYISGSGGGIKEMESALLASRGFRVFALGYFKYKDRPPVAANMPIEYFGDALQWAASQVPDGRVAIAGSSFGGMTSLMIASEYPDLVKAVFAGVPSHIHMNGMNETFEPGFPMYTRGGNPIAFASSFHLLGATMEERLKKLSLGTLGDPLRSGEYFMRSWVSDDVPAGAFIPVENIKAPIMLTGGGDDSEWPSNFAVAKIVERLDAKNYSYPVEHYVYEGASHYIDYPELAADLLSPAYFPPGFWFTPGGYGAATGPASFDVPPKMAAFFKKYLCPRPSQCRSQAPEGGN